MRASRCRLPLCPLPLFPPLLLLALLISTASINAFSWPRLGSKKECVRSIKAVAYSISTYAANSPIEDRHIVVDEQSSSLFSLASNPLPLFHAAVFDGHGGSEVAEMVKNNLVGKVKETIAKLPAHAQKDETVVRGGEKCRENEEGKRRREMCLWDPCISHAIS